MSRLALALTSLVALSAAPAEEPLTTRFKTAWNLHATQGASGERIDSTVRIWRLAGGKARLEDAGVKSESNLDRFGYQQQKVRWSNLWLGTWAAKGDSLLLQLELSKRDCELTRTDREEETHSECPEAKARVSVECKPAQIPLVPSELSPDAARKPHSVWECQPAENAELGGSPLPWIIDKELCLEISSMRSRREYHPCPPSVPNEPAPGK